MVGLCTNLASQSRTQWIQCNTPICRLHPSRCPTFDQRCPAATATTAINHRGANTLIASLPRRIPPPRTNRRTLCRCIVHRTSTHTSQPQRTNLPGRPLLPPSRRKHLPAPLPLSPVIRRRLCQLSSVPVRRRQTMVVECIRVPCRRPSTPSSSPPPPQPQPLNRRPQRQLATQ